MIVFFNAPLDQPDHARRAVQAAITLQQVVAAYRLRQPPGEPHLHFGVGINTGPALIGNIGAAQRLTYTATGDTVNLAARITSAVPADEVWLSQATYDDIPAAIVVEPLSPLTFKGKSEPTPLFRVRL
jgi:adenylate cyclase